MRPRFLLPVLLLLCAAGARGQSTSLTINVTDQGGQTWNNGTYTLTFIGPAQVNWQGGPFNRTLSGSLNSSGSATRSTPDNNTISPSPTFWTVSVCPDPNVSAPLSGCFIFASQNITGSVQTLTVTPPAISISASTTYPVAAYSDAEITPPVKAGFEYFNVTSGFTRVWNGSAWVNQGVSGSGTVTHTLGALTLGESVIGNGAGDLLVSNATLDASAFQGTHWTDKVVVAYSSSQCAAGCTIIVPDSIAGDGSATTPTLPSNVGLYFSGSAVFGFCNLNLGHFYNVKGSGNATLRETLNGCTGITETVADQMATGFRDTIERINVDCNFTTTSTGITLQAAGGNASVDAENDTVRNCTIYGLSLNSQFGTFRGISLFNNTIDCNCSGSSNTFYDIKSVGTGQVGISILDGQGQIFINPQIQNKTVAGMAVDFDGTGAQTHVIIEGGSPELNGGGAASTTINGRTINQAGSLFVNASVVDWYSDSTQDATTSPDILVQGGGSVNLHDTRGTLAVGGFFCQAGDLNSYCNYYGTLQAAGMNNGVGNWPSAFQASLSNVNNGLDLIGQPLFVINPNIPNLYNGNPMTPPLSFCGAGVTCSTAVDPQFGTVSTVAYAASVGTQCAANCAAIANMITTPLAAANDIQMSFYVKASTSTLIKFYCGGGHFCGPNSGFTVNPNWQRLMIYMPNQASSTNVFMQMTALDSAGATLSITGLQVNQCAAQTAACIEQMGTVTSTGAVNPLGFNASASAYEQIQGTKFTATGCTNGTTLGGATGGSLLTGASGACTLTVTMGAGVAPATNGWTCSASDQTTAAGNPIFQNGGSTTTATLSLPAGNVSGDKISFSCRAF